MVAKHFIHMQTHTHKHTCFLVWSCSHGLPGWGELISFSFQSYHSFCCFNNFFSYEPCICLLVLLPLSAIEILIGSCFIQFAPLLIKIILLICFILEAHCGHETFNFSEFSKLFGITGIFENNYVLSVLHVLRTEHIEMCKWYPDWSIIITG